MQSLRHANGVGIIRFDCWNSCSSGVCFLPADWHPMAPKSLFENVDRPKAFGIIVRKVVDEVQGAFELFFFDCIFFWSLIIDILISLADSHYLRAGSFKSGNLVSDGVT